MKLRNSRSGALVLVGNGPSLNNFDLRSIKYPTMAMNGISTIYERTPWRPTYYVCVATASTESGYREVMKPSVDNAQWSFLNKEAVYKDAKSVLLERDEELNWYDDILERVGVFGTSSFACMQIAAYLGYKSIYMIGFDGGYQNPVDEKFVHYFSPDYPRSATVDYEQVDWPRLNKDHQTALAYGFGKLKERGIKVFSVERLN